MSELVTQLALIFGVPWAIGKVIQLINKSRSTDTRVTSSSDGGRFSDHSIRAMKAYLLKNVKISPISAISKFTISIFLLGLLAWHLYALMYQRPVNFMDDIDVSYDAPNYQLRNAFRDYAEIRRDEDMMRDEDSIVVDYDEVMEHSKCLFPRMTSSSQSTSTSDTNASSTEYSQYDWHNALYESLKIGANRHSYLMFGEYSFRNCSWCREDSDLFIFNLPYVLKSYLLLALVIGIACIVPEKQFVRHYLAYLVASVCMSSVMLLAIPDTYIPEVFQVKYVPMFMFVSHQIYHGVAILTISILSIAGTFQKSASTVQVTDADRLAFITQAVGLDVVDKLKMLHLYHSAVMGDVELAQKWFKHELQRQKDADVGEVSNSSVDKFFREKKTLRNSGLKQ